MNDVHPRPTAIETRVAVLEEQVRAFNLRLTAVSDRAYGLNGSMEAVLTGQRDATAQRNELTDKLDEVQATIHALREASVKATTELAFHSQRCEQRSARLERLAWFALSILLTVFGFLAVSYFTRLGLK